MKETKIQLTQRKIRNGKRKELVQRQMQMWDTLRTQMHQSPHTGYTGAGINSGFIYAPYHLNGSNLLTVDTASA